MADIPSWPVVRNDTIETLGEPAFLVLLDRTRVVVAENSRVSLSGASSGVQVRLLKGAMDYTLPPGSSTVFFDGQTQLPSAPTGEGHVESGNGRIDPPNGPPGTKAPPHERSRSPSAPGQDK